MITKLLIACLVLLKYSEGKINKKETTFNDLDEHTLVNDNNVFPYVVAILKMSTFLSAGALIHEQWVLTAGDSLFLVRESTRALRVRLGSTNYKKGGIIVPVKFFEIHPDFDDSSPVFDLALVRLPDAVRFTPSIKSIRLEKKFEEADATHFVVTSWPSIVKYSDESNQVKSMEVINRRRLLTVTHLHPSDLEDCVEELHSAGINDTDSMMCLDTGAMEDPCLRDVGAPVVLNEVLWGIISSWKPSNCANDLAGPSFVSLVSAPKIASWIQATIKELHSWG